MPQVPIAIVGVSALFPGSLDKSGFWRDILAGKDLVTDVPSSHWRIEDYYDPNPAAPDKTYSKRGAFLPNVDFDPVLWGVPPSVVPATDTCQLLALIVAQQVLEDACQGQFAEMKRDRASVILGVTSAQELLGSMVSRLQRPVWVKALRETGLPEDEVIAACDRISSNYTPWQENTFPGVLGNVVAGRIANRLNLGGTNCVTDAACASSFSALSMAVNELSLDQSDLVICGGADTMNDIFMYMCFSKTPALSKTGDCRPFSDRADGTLLGEGIGMVALKRLSDAERQGDRIYAVLRGVGASSDGRANSVYAPAAAGQAKALRRAYEQAGYSASTVELVEAHGTGTVAGDAAEFEGLKTVFAESSDKAEWCALGSIKSQIGHTKAAAGAAGLFKVVMALHHKVLPPTIKVDRPNPALAIETSAFYLNTQARPWIRGSDAPRRASVSAFGFGGSNFHITLEEYLGPADKAFRVRASQTELVLLGADTPALLAKKCEALASDATISGMLAFLAKSTQASFDAHSACRVSIVAESEADLAAKLQKASSLIATGKPVSTPNGIEFDMGAPATADEVALIFPGQGSQYPHMGADLAMTFDTARAAWDLAAGSGLQNVVFPKAAFSDAAIEAQRTTLTKTEWAQPAIGAMSLSLLRLLRDMGLEAAAFAGHSFGEVTALFAAGVLTEEDFLAVARTRGQHMASAAGGSGAMTSVLAKIEDVRARLEEWGSDVVIANHNSPNQVVLSGAKEAIKIVEEKLGALGMTTMRLDVSAAFHSPLVAASAAPFRASLEAIAFATPVGDVYSNTTAEPYPTAPAAIRATLAEQIARPVRFVEQIEAMYARGIRTFVEVGPGRTLTSMVSHILKGRPFRAIAFDRKGRKGLTSLHEALGQLAVAGISLDFATLWTGFEPVLDPRTREKPKLVLKLNGANYAKPYPPAEGVLPMPNPPRPALTVSHAPVPVHVPAPAPAPAQMLHAPVQHAPVQHAPVHAPMVSSNAWAEVFQESQRQTAEAHIAFQRSMADTHSAFLRTMETSFTSLGAMLHGEYLPAPARMMALPAPQAARAPVAVAPVAAAPVPVKRAPEAPKPQPAAVHAAPAPIRAPAHAAPAPAVAVSASPTVDLRTLLLQIVAAKTGYPEEMLGVDMDLESDLGVDSIKRVEILAAVRGKLPRLPDLNPAEMRVLRTLAQIATYLEQKLGGGGKSSDKASPPAARAEPDAPEAPPPAVATTAPKPAAPKLGRFVVRAIPATALGLAAPGLLSAREVIITDDKTGVSHELAKAFHARGVSARVLDSVPSDAEAVVFLGGLRQIETIDHAIAVQREAYRAAKAIAGVASSRAAAFVTVQDTGGDFGLRAPASGANGTRAWLGGLPGLVKSAAHEWPKAHLRALDVERGSRSPEAMAEAIAAELLAGGPELEVGLRADGTRLTVEAFREVAAVATPGSFPLTARSVVVVSGGARGVTAGTVIELAKKVRCRFLLLGRTALKDDPSCCNDVIGDAALKRALLTDAKDRKEAVSPADLANRVSAIEANREIRSTLEALKAAGSDARYVPVDVTDTTALGAALDGARKAWGPINAIIHGAGVIHDRLILEKTEAQFDRVFDTKIAGLRALLEATANDPIEVLCAYSSIAARTGNRGQSDYAMANEILNKVVSAERARRPGLRVASSLNWGPWAGGMVTPALRAHFEQLEIPLIPIAEGAQMLMSELSSGSDVEVVLGAEPRATSRLRSAEDGTMALELVVSRRSHPYLDDHRVGGLPVLPVAVVLDAFARLTHACRPDLLVVGVQSLRVLRGIRLAHFEGHGDRFVLRAKQLSNGDGATFSVELLGADGAKHYAATTETRPRRPVPTTDTQPPLEGLAPWQGDVYGRTLFHGPAFQAIRPLKGVATAGAEATLAGASALGWGTAVWQLDPAIVDGGLQLALLWTEHVLHAASLPTAIEGVSIYGDGLPQGPIGCVLHRRAVDKERAVCDVLFLANNGTVVAKLRGVETHLLPAPATVSTPAASSPQL